MGAPNQRELLSDTELAALNNRYSLAKRHAQQQNITVQLTAFEKAVQVDSKAVMNLSAKLLDDFLSSDNMLMSNYNLQTAGETRTVADMQNDKHRRGTEGVLFGAYANKIRYAALSLDEKGLVSYGNCSIVINDVTTLYSATVLEKNSYDFVQQHKVYPGKDVPAGYRATWEQRHLLATAKLAARINTKTQDWAHLLLESNGDRRQDEFIEVHIYGAFDKQAINKVTVPNNAKQHKDEHERLMVLRICDYAKQQKIDCIEI